MQIIKQGLALQLVQISHSLMGHFFTSLMLMIAQKDVLINVQNFLVFMAITPLIDVFQFVLRALMEMMTQEYAMINASSVLMQGLITQLNIHGLTLSLISVPATAQDYLLQITQLPSARLTVH